MFAKLTDLESHWLDLGLNNKKYYEDLTERRINLKQ